MTRPVSARRRRWGRAARRLVTGLALLGAAVVTIAAGSPALHIANAFWAGASAFAPYGVLAWGLVALLLLLDRPAGVFLAPVAGALAVLHLVWLWPSVPAQRPPLGEPRLTVMTLNTYYGWADGPDVTAAADRFGPDLVVLNEVTDTPLVDQAPWRAQFPYVLGEKGRAWSSDNTMVFSRYPLTALRSDAGRGFEVFDIDLPGGRVRVIAVHLTNPTTDVAAWSGQFTRLRESALEAGGHGLLVLGDFNAVPEHQPYRQLLEGTGLVDAAISSGAGRVLTYPADGHRPDLNVGFAVPLLAIDHVLATADLACSSLESFAVSGTDHLGLVARC